MCVRFCVFKCVGLGLFMIKNNTHFGLSLVNIAKDLREALTVLGSGVIFMANLRPFCDFSVCGQNNRTLSSFISPQQQQTDIFPPIFKSIPCDQHVTGND